MFCYQCEQTNLGKGAIEFGNLRKDSDVAMLQTCYLPVEGIGFYASSGSSRGSRSPTMTISLVIATSSPR